MTRWWLVIVLLLSLGVNIGLLDLGHHKPPHGYDDGGSHHRQTAENDEYDDERAEPLLCWRPTGWLSHFLPPRDHPTRFGYTPG